MPQIIYFCRQLDIKMSKKTDQKILNNLKSDSEAVVVSAIKELRNKGNRHYINELVSLLRRTDKDVIKNELLLLINDLCDNSVAPDIMTEIKDPVNSKIMGLLVSSCWQSRLNYADYFSDFVDIALTADYETTIEAISVIENILMNEGVDDLTISNELYKVKERISSCQPEKLLLIQELVKILGKK